MKLDDFNNIWFEYFDFIDITRYIIENKRHLCIAKM